MSPPEYGLKVVLVSNGFPFKLSVFSLPHSALPYVSSPTLGICPFSIFV